MGRPVHILSCVLPTSSSERSTNGRRMMKRNIPQSCSLFFLWPLFQRAVTGSHYKMGRKVSRNRWIFPPHTHTGFQRKWEREAKERKYQKNLNQKQDRIEGPISPCQFRWFPKSLFFFFLLFRLTLFFSGARPTDRPDIHFQNSFFIPRHSLSPPDIAGLIRPGGI